MKDFTEKVLPYFSRRMSPHLKPAVHSVYRLDDIAEAHRTMEKNKNIGKIVIQIPDLVPGTQ